jgi:predicted phosphodiesterase
MAQERVDRVADALDATQPPDQPRRTSARPSDPWAPGYDIEGDEGTLTTDRLPDGTDPDWAAIFEFWGLDPAAWQVVDAGNLRVNAWQMPGPEGELRVHRQYKATIRRRTAESDRFDTDRHLAGLAKWKPRRLKPVSGEGAAWVVNPADFQIGGRGGVEAFQSRFDAAMGDLVAEARRKRREGVTDLVVAYLGDMGEGTWGNYPAQSFEIDLDRDDQTRLVAAAELLVLRELAPYFARTTAVAVPGNHTRNNSNYETGEGDVADITSFKWTASLLVASGEADRHNMRFVLPDKHEGTLIARVEAGGTSILFSHGHKSAGDATKLKAWWKGVAFSRWGDADACDHLVTGHRHHTHIEEVSLDRWIMVCPTLGGESPWFHAGGGATSRPGILHYTTRDKSVEDIGIAGAYRSPVEP